MFNLEDNSESFPPKRIHYFNMTNLLYYFNQKDFVITYKCNVLMLLVLFKLIFAVIIVSICTRNHVQPGKEFPLCSGNLLDNREHHYAKEADGSYDNSRMISKLGSCQLTRYTFEQVVTCFNALCERHHLSWNNSSNNLNVVDRLHKNLHFAFIGDSRMRQQFLNFLKVNEIVCEKFRT
jgi:hypothetical protein